MTNWYLIYFYALSVSFVVCLFLTEGMRRMALRWGALDAPGERKMHQSPIPLLGGVAICITFHAVILGSLLALEPVRRLGFTWLERGALAFMGTDVRWKLAGLLGGGLITFALGVVDDLIRLSPEKKLVGQVAAAAVLVWSGVRLELFLPGSWVSILATMVWVVMMMNAMNFLDNMDGLCGGVSVIAALSFFLCVFPTQQYFVCLLLMIFIGAVAGFLYHNLNPAKIFMGDAGSMFCGYLLATVAVLGTFYEPGAPSRIAVAAPLLALAVPIFDLVGVVYIRWRSGHSIMKGDKRHFSHRLVELGMSPRQAVEFIFLVAAVTGLGAALLPHVGWLGTLVIIAQVVGIFGLIVLLMNAKNNRSGGRGR